MSSAKVCRVVALGPGRQPSSGDRFRDRYLVPRSALRAIAAHSRFLSERRPGSTLNLAFDHTDEKARDGDSGRSRMATMNRQKIPAERLHPRAVY